MSAAGATRAGFTLLEVMIAVVILAVGLSSLFTTEAGAVRLAQRARTTTIATLLARCKMGEIEEEVAKKGWPESTMEERDECCEDAEHDGFRCEWKLERIKLPDVEKEEGKEDEEGGEGDKGEKKPGMLDRLAEFSQGSGETKDPSSALNTLLSGEALTGTSGSGSEDEEGEPMDPIGAMAMELAFPVLKPVIEQGVRRATVNVLWREGSKEQNLEVVQFLVSEEQIILPDEEHLQQQQQQQQGGQPGAQPSGNTPASGSSSGGFGGSGLRGATPSSGASP